MRRLTELNMHNRYLGTKVGIEVESVYDLMEWAEDVLPMFAAGNSESSKIYEGNTTPTLVSNPIEVALLGEVVRRCIPGYTEGGSDRASCSAHCHVSEFKTEISIDQMEVLMFGLMPFMSLAWCRNNCASYTFRSSVVGEGECYGRFLSVSQGHDYHNSYAERSTWVKDQSNRWGRNSFEFRANENSPLWIYFITTILSDSTIVDKLTATLHSSEFAEVTSQVSDGGTPEGLEAYHNIAAGVVRLIVPKILKNMDNIVGVLPEDSQEFMHKLLTAYVTEDEVTYNSLMALIIEADSSIGRLFDKLDTECAKYSELFFTDKD